MVASKNAIVVHEIKEVSLGSVFPHESLHFTPWLAEAENIGRLGHALNFELEVVATEASTGTFRTDILARRLQDGAMVVIANQFGRSDHDHFGKSLTYLSSHEASVVVWIAERFADEHRASLAWLNDHTDDEFEFWAVVPRVLRIADSPPGLRFEVVVAPNRLVKEARKTDRKLDESVSILREAFWGVFLEEVAQDSALSKCGTRYGGRLGFIWIFPENTGPREEAESHMLVFLSISEPAAVGYGAYCRKGADPSVEARTDAAFQAGVDRLASSGVDPGDRRGRYARLAADLSTEEGMRDVARRAVERVRVCMEVLANTEQGKV